MTPLFKKLNFKNQKTVHVMGHPTSFLQEIEAMQAFVTFSFNTSEVDLIEFIVIFVMSQDDIKNALEKIISKCNENTILWFCYPKGTSKKYKCAINRDNGWQMLGDLGYEGVRQIAIDEDWSALRFKKVETIKTLKRDFAMSAMGKKRTGKL